ncbi:U11/U12 small nuclear ribonucleoprotein 48 kDa protein-like isoform X2 [Liolophura sinensis]
MEIIAARLKAIEEIKVFCKQCDEITDSVCQALSWEKVKLKTESSDLVSCQYDQGHRVPRDSLFKHEEQCYLRRHNLTQEDIDELAPSSQFYYSKSDNVFSTVLDKETQNSILRQLNPGLATEKEVPITPQQATLELTPAERSAVHQYVIKAAKEAGKPVSELSDALLFADLTRKEDSKDSEPKSKAEALALQRDLKRRRQSYRAKNVHITKKSYTEVIREVIENQTDMLRQTAQASDSLSESLHGEEPTSSSPTTRHSSSGSHIRSRSRRRSRSRSRRRSESRSQKRSDSRKRFRSRSRSQQRSRSSSRSRRSPFRSGQSDRGTDDSPERHKTGSRHHKKKHKKHKSHKS